MEVIAKLKLGYHFFGPPGRQIGILNRHVFTNKEIHLSSLKTNEADTDNRLS